MRFTVNSKNEKCLVHSLVITEDNVIMWKEFGKWNQT